MCTFKGTRSRDEIKSVLSAYAPLVVKAIASNSEILINLTISWPVPFERFSKTDNYIFNFLFDWQNEPGLSIQLLPGWLQPWNAPRHTPHLSTILTSSTNSLPGDWIHIWGSVFKHWNSHWDLCIQRWKSQRIQIHRLGYRFSIDF